ncbi:hypothetical protein Tco_0314598 [Tanacetum coccineum]
MTNRNIISRFYLCQQEREHDQQKHNQQEHYPAGLGTGPNTNGSSKLKVCAGGVTEGHGLQSVPGCASAVLPVASWAAAFSSSVARQQQQWQA